MFRRPPALAVWLLDRLGYTRQNAALAGDLLEEFRNGRSAGWYWRQTLAVIAAGFSQHLASIAPYVLAVSAGFAVQFSLSYALWSLGWPPAVRGSGWAKAGLWTLMQAAGWFAAAAPMKSKMGQWSVPLRPMFYAAASDRQQRATILALASMTAFRLAFGPTACAHWSSGVSRRPNS